MKSHSLTASLIQRTSQGQTAFVPYIMAGDGGLEVLHERISLLTEYGSDAIEIGIPFSDPVADGDVIQQAGTRALARGVTLRSVLSELQKKKHDVPLVMMTYLNPILAYGVAPFVLACEKAGVRGLIIPDLPYEERELVASVLRGKDIALVPLVSLTSSPERIKKIARAAEGFIYAVTVNGITGERQGFDEELTGHLDRLKQVSKVPVLAGFGISTPGQVCSFQKSADGVIVGSAIVKAFHAGDEPSIRALIQAGRTAVLQRS